MGELSWGVGWIGACVNSARADDCEDEYAIVYLLDPLESAVLDQHAEIYPTYVVE
jgi:hypothetical protein